MDFIPYKPSAEIKKDIEAKTETKTRDINNIATTATIKTKIEETDNKLYLQPKQQYAKNKFIEKYNLKLLTMGNQQYYYDYKSKALYICYDNKPIFVKIQDKQLEKNILLENKIL